jgi:hypothetical protein
MGSLVPGGKVVKVTYKSAKLLKKLSKSKAVKLVKVVNKNIIDSATKHRRGGETVVGHALQKHAGRNPNIWGKIKGGPDQINEMALKHLKEILNAPGVFKRVTNSNGNTLLEKKLKDGRGVRLNLDGTFKGFIDQ